MWKIAICDDVPIEQLAIEAILRQYGESRNLTINTICFSDGTALASAFENGSRFDFIILDIIMDKMDGIDTARCIRRVDSRVPIIFLTSSRDYAVESYEVQAAGYLLKPVEPQRLFSCLDKFLQKKNTPRLALRTQGGIRYYYYSDIMYFEARDHLVYTYLDNGEELRCNESLKQIEDQLAGDTRFYRCHKGYIVNMDFIEQVDDVFILTSGARVPYRIRGKKKIIDDYYRYFLEQNLN